MDAKFIYKAIKRKNSDGATVGEISIEDTYYIQENAKFSLYDKEIKECFVDPLHVTDPLYDMKQGKFLRRIDALLLKGDIWTAVEIKVSRADFLKDSYEKRYIWKKHAHKFVYAAPKGLISPDEIPAGCGLWEIDVNGKVTSRKNASTNKNRVPFPEHFMKRIFWRLSISESKRR